MKLTSGLSRPCSLWTSTCLSMGKDWYQAEDKTEGLPGYHITSSSIGVCSLDSLPAPCQEIEPSPPELSEKTTEDQVARQNPWHWSPQQGKYSKEPHPACEDNFGFYSKTLFVTASGIHSEESCGFSKWILQYHPSAYCHYSKCPRNSQPRPTYCKQRRWPRESGATVADKVNWQGTFKVHAYWFNCCCLYCQKGGYCNDT